MSPPIHKDWWLAAALTSATLPTALAQPANVDRRQGGVVTTVTQGPSRSATSSAIYVDNATDRRLTTDANSTIHVLFSDQSAITVGPNSDIVITDFKFDNQTKDGRIVVSMAKGLLRVVGGYLSKNRDTQIRTATATIGIRGGISLVEHEDRHTRGDFLFGQSMRMASPDGSSSELITRPGFGADASDGGVSAPNRTSPGDLASKLARFEHKPPPPPAPPPPPGPPDRKSGEIAPDRVGPPPDTGPGYIPPSLNDLLGSQAPGNQS